MQASIRRLSALAALGALLGAARPARADATGWMSLGGGATSWKNGGDTTLDGTMAFDIGAGTAPQAPLIFGGIFRLAPVFGHGPDLGLLARGATRSFQTGPIGVAIDAGGYSRFWGAKSAGFAGDVILGLPLGLQLSFQTEIGSHDAFALGAVAGVDLLRLTVYRGGLTSYWPNPSPSPGRSSAWARPIAF